MGYSLVSLLAFQLCHAEWFPEDASVDVDGCSRHMRILEHEKSIKTVLPFTVVLLGAFKWCLFLQFAFRVVMDILWVPKVYFSFFCFWILIWPTWNRYSEPGLNPVSCLWWCCRSKFQHKFRIVIGSGVSWFGLENWLQLISCVVLVRWFRSIPLFAHL